MDASVFADFDYVALGHIHSPRCGLQPNPLLRDAPQVFLLEAAHHKSVTVVELGKRERTAPELVPLIPRHDLREIRGSFAELTDKAYYDGTDTEDYLHIILTDEEDIPEASGKLSMIYPNYMQFSYDNTRTRTNQVVDAVEMSSAKAPWSY